MNHIEESRKQQLIGRYNDIAFWARQYRLAFWFIQIAGFVALIMSGDFDAAVPFWLVSWIPLLLMLNSARDMATLDREIRETVK